MDLPIKNGDFPVIYIFLYHFFHGVAPTKQICVVIFAWVLHLIPAYLVGYGSSFLCPISGIPQTRSRRHGCEAAMISSKPGNTMKYLQDSIQTYIHTDIRTDIHVYIYLYIYIYIHVYIYIYIYVCMYPCLAFCRFVLLNLALSSLC